MITVVAVDDRRNTVVGADLEELGLELLVLADVDRVRGVGQAHLFQHDGSLAAVGRRPGVEVDHGTSILWCGLFDYSAATGTASSLVLARALPMNSRLASKMSATSTSTKSARPMSMRKPNGTGVSACPSGSPALTKPNTLPICPGGAASLTIRSRGVRLAPTSTPPAHSTTKVSAW